MNKAFKVDIESHHLAMGTILEFAKTTSTESRKFKCNSNCLKSFLYKSENTEFCRKFKSSR
jgi:hypothetical protein